MRLLAQERPNSLQPKPVVPSAADLKTAAQTAFKTAESLGVAYDQSAIQGLKADLATTLRDSGFRNHNLSSGVKDALDEMDDLIKTGGPVSYKDLDVVRSLATNSKPFGRDVGIFRDKINGFVNSADPTIASGDPAAAAAAGANARSLWQKMAKSNTIEDLVDRATIKSSGTNVLDRAAALRNEFKALALNKGKMASFDPDEQALIRNIAGGGGITQRTLYRLGSVLPNRTLRGLGLFGSRGCCNLCPSGRWDTASGNRTGCKTDCQRHGNQQGEHACRFDA